MATIDVTDSPYDAAGDGTTDDTAAINAAIDDATAGDTVLIPATADSYLVSVSNRAAVDFTGVADDVTITGEGPDSVLKMGDVPDDKNTWVIGAEANKDPLTGVTVRQLTLDGSREVNGNDSTAGINFYPGGGGHDIRIEDVVCENCAGTGFSNRGAGSLTLRRVTARNNGQHGFDFTGAGESTDTDAVSLKSVDNDGTGIDFHNGNHVAEDVYCDSNRSGTKLGDSGGFADSVVLRNANLRNARENSGFRETMTPEDGDTDISTANTDVTLDRVQVVDAALNGFRLSDSANYTVTEILTDGSGNSSRNRSGVYITDRASVDADVIRSQNADHGPAVENDSSESSSVATLYDYNNPGEAAEDRSGTLSVDEIRTEQSAELDVPGPDDVGAYTGGGDEPSANPATPVRTTGGVLNTTGGVLATTPTSTTAVVDSFESGSLDAAWDGSTGRYSVLDASNDQFSAVDGQYVLACAPDNGTGVVYSTGGLDNYFPKGSVGRFYVRYGSTPDGNSEFRGWFGVSDTGNYYEATVGFADGEFHLRRNDGGAYRTLVSNTTVSLSAGQWYEVTVTWDDGTLGGSDDDITLALAEYDPASDSTTTVTSLPTQNDATHASADGVGLRGYSNGSSRVYVDFYHVE